MSSFLAREHEDAMSETIQLSIGQVAKAANVNVETIRYYQRRGLLTEPTKPLGGHRRYSNQVVNKLRFIKRAQALGFTLEEIKNLLRLDGVNSCSATHDLAMHKLELIKAKMVDLAAMRDVLTNLVRQCKIGNPQAGCPIIQVLVDS